MKKCIFLLLIFFMIGKGGIGYSQEAQSFGAKAGLAFTTLSNQPDLNLKPGLQAGVFAKLGGRQSLFFKSEFLLSQKGTWNWSSDNPINFSLYYIDLPLMFGVDITRGLTVNAGIQPSMLLGGSLKTAQGRRSIGNDLARFDYSLLIGAEYFVKEFWFIGLRYNYSYVPIQNDSGEFTRLNLNQLLANRAIQLYVGYTFN